MRPVYESNADKEDPQPSTYDNIPFSRQISDRVIHETATLRARASYTSAKRITTGTGEVYEVRDGGTGERAIFKPAVEKSHRPLLSVEAEESRSEGRLKPAQIMGITFCCISRSL